MPPPENQGSVPSFSLRALRDDVERPVVVLGGDLEVVLEEGDVDGPGGVLALTDREAGGTGAQGHLGRRLYRAPDGALLELARWSSPLMVARARTAGLLTADPVLYLRDPD